MILTILTGGLGNQMFQYAAAKHLSLRRRTPLKLHFANALTNTPRALGLNYFNIHAEIATSADLKSFGYPHSTAGRIIKRIFQDLKLYSNSKIYMEKKEYVYDPHVLKLTSNICLEGYWQNEKYFQPISKIIRNEFTFKKTANVQNQNILNIMKRTNSISVHVRRGDYLANKSAYPPLHLEYYKNSLNYFKSRLLKPRFFVFSDDIIWCKTNLGAKNISYIAHNANTPHEDLRLMSTCKHNIIANSAFSWWGSWLNTSLDKIVIAPDKWINNPFSRKMISKKWITFNA